MNGGTEVAIPYHLRSRRQCAQCGGGSGKETTLVHHPFDRQGEAAAAINDVCSIRPGFDRTEGSVKMSAVAAAKHHLFFVANEARRRGDKFKNYSILQQWTIAPPPLFARRFRRHHPKLEMVRPPPPPTTTTTTTTATDCTSEPSSRRVVPTPAPSLCCSV